MLIDRTANITILDLPRLPCELFGTLLNGNFENCAPPRPWYKSVEIEGKPQIAHRRAPSSKRSWRMLGGGGSQKGRGFCWRAPSTSLPGYRTGFCTHIGKETLAE